ncbi:MAG: DPP IV N-terminal domain-containing protein [Flavobacteriales bacterium]|nr:DPP IV N-terminal domain-containing protein [Flavobacteriales bacterium]
MIKSILNLCLIILTCTITQSSFAQKTELTLDEAVSQQYRKFYPTSLAMFSWVPDTDCYTYLESYQKLMKASVRNTEAKEILSIQQLNEKLESELNWFSGFEWKNENEFWVNDGQKYYSYNIVDEKGKLIHVLDKPENTTFHNETENIAYTKQNNVYVHTGEGLKIVVTDNTDKNIVSGQAIARSEFGITNGLFWSPNGGSIAYYQKDESKVADYPLLDNSVTPGKLTSIKYPMTGQDSEKAKVGVYNLSTRNTVFISAREGEENYLTNLSWTPDNKYVVIAEVNRDQNHYWLNVFDATTGEFIRTLLEEENDKWVEPEHAAFFPNDESNNFVWISEKSGFNNLYYYDFNGNLIRQLTDHSFVIKDIITYKNNQIYYNTTGESPLDTKVFSVDLKGKSKMITRIGGTHSVSFSTDGKYIHDRFSSHDVPGNDLILASSGKMLKSLLVSPNLLENHQIGTAEIGTISAQDGTTLHTRLIKPSNFDSRKKYPVLVYVYGGPHAQLVTNTWLDGASLWMYWMAEQGYLVYTVDNRGSANRGFAFESQIHRQCGTVEMEDQISGVEYLKSLPYVEGDRLAVHGWSYGGFMTTSLMLRNAGVYQVGVAGGPVTDWKYYEAMYGERYMDRPDQNEKGYEKASLMTHAGNLKGDLLLIHGTIDDVVVMQHNFALVQKFVDLGIQMDFFPYPMHKHNVRGKDRIHLMRKILDYVIEKNK